MTISVDTNVLVRAAVRDNLAQAQAAEQVLREASSIVVALSCLCEFVWVLRRVYGFQDDEIISSLRSLLAIDKVIVNRPAVELGIALLTAGGDFADGVIAHEGRSLGATAFVSFDRKALTLLARQGYATRELGPS